MSCTSKEDIGLRLTLYVRYRVCLQTSTNYNSPSLEQTVFGGQLFVSESFDTIHHNRQKLSYLAQWKQRNYLVMCWTELYVCVCTFVFQKTGPSDGSRCHPSSNERSVWSNNVIYKIHVNPCRRFAGIWGRAQLDTVLVETTRKFFQKQVMLLYASKTLLDSERNRKSLRSKEVRVQKEYFLMLHK